MRLNLHDFSGHPFQVQLSRELATRGHEVVHGYSTQFVTGRGRLETDADDPPSLRIAGLTCARPMVKYSPVGRARFERAYADAWQAMLAREHFDLVVACNVPLFTLARMTPWLARRNQAWVLWHQDLYSLGVAAEADRVLPGSMATLARRTAERLERTQVQGANGVVAITEAMVEQYHAWGLSSAHVQVIPNWAPIDDIVPLARNNSWARGLGLPDSGVRLLYAGTLGRKHNPRLLLEVLDGVQRRGVPATLVVASEGTGADDLADMAGDRGDVRIVGYQPADRFSEVLSSADVVIALLEPDASRFSVPSKVLSYLSAGRPIVALLPRDNQAAFDVDDAGGFVGSPNAEGAQAAAEWVASTAADPTAWASIGAQSRILAEKRFDIVRIADEFEQTFDRVLAARPVAARTSFARARASRVVA